MSRTSRFVTGAILAALAGVALAAPAEAGDTSLSFSGSSPLGLALLSCASTPSKGSVSITTDETLNVENVTGHAATVYINGSKTSHQVGNNQSVPITFPAGQWKVALAPTCLLNLSDAGTATVNVTTPAAVTVPAATPTATKTSVPAPTKTSTPQTNPPTHAPTGQPRSGGTPTPTPTPTRTPVPATSASASAPGLTTGTTGTTGAGSGSGSGTSSASTGKSSQDSTGTSKSGTGAVASGQDVNIGVAQALPAADSSPATPNYLLAVIALISILGVGSAVVRALNNQRQARRAAY